MENTELIRSALPDRMESMPQFAIPCLFMRGGTSRGPYLLASDLPADVTSRDRVLLAMMGSPDARQIDGIGGGDSLTSKVAILSPSQQPDCDVDYLFAQVKVTEPAVDTSANCGNILSGVGPAAILRDLVPVQDDTTTVRVFNTNTKTRINVNVQTPQGQVEFAGDARIDGVPGTAAPIQLEFLDVLGPRTGDVFPTGSRTDEIGGVPVTCIDSANPTILLHAEALGEDGHERPEELDADHPMLVRLESIRRAASLKMGLGDATGRVTPKVALLSPPREGGHVCSRYFVPDHCHAAHAITGAISIAVAAAFDGTVAESITGHESGNQCTVVVEHPAGHVDIVLKLDPKSDGQQHVLSAGVLRTARLLMEGQVFIPAVALE